MLKNTYNERESSSQKLNQMQIFGSTTVITYNHMQYYYR